MAPRYIVAVVAAALTFAATAGFAAALIPRDTAGETQDVPPIVVPTSPPSAPTTDPTPPDPVPPAPAPAPPPPPADLDDDDDDDDDDVGDDDD